MSLEVECEMRDRAYRICRDYLHGTWKYIEAKDMIIKHISGGLSNHLFYCALPSSVSPGAFNEPSEVLVRFYGQVHGEEALESILAESVIFTLLSERRLGPRLYGVFPGGRLEQYIPARCMTTAELSVPELSRQIAITMARIHTLNVPISKEPTWLSQTMERWLKSSEEFLSDTTSPIYSSSFKILEKLRHIPYRHEIDFLQRIISRTQSPVVFAHNDMQEGNILINDNESKLSDKISLIDFEYCSYNYRGFDLANHFCEWMYCYKEDKEPFFRSDFKGFPSREQQLNFIRAYLGTADAAINGRKPTSSLHFEKVASSSNTRGSESFSSNCIETSSTSSNLIMDEPSIVPHPSEDTLLREVQVFTLASHLFWSLWGIVQGHVSKIPFGYLEYALTRMEHYYASKKSLNHEELSKKKSMRNYLGE